MNWIFDQPAWIIISGMVCAAICGMLWANTGKNAFLIALGGVVILTIALLIVERTVETDSEALRRTVREIAADVARNDRQLLYKYIHSHATALKQKADSELPSYSFENCTVTKIYDVKVTGTEPPRKATIAFMARADGNFQLGSDSIGGQFLRFVTLHFEQEADGTWKVVNYEHSAPTQAWMNDSGGSTSGNEEK